MLGVSAMLGNSGHSAAAAAPGANGGGGGNGGEVGVIGPSSVGSSEEEKVRIEESERNSGGNRWPRQETLALLKIRSEMDVAFRDSSLKGPLWEEVSRKLAELGYHRNAKKCKEKFENVYKYHRRTKDGRSSKPDGKTYRFFDQLQALENQPPSLPLLPPPPMPQTHQAPPPPPPAAVTMRGTNTQLVSPPPVSTVPSTANPTIALTPNLNHSSNVLSSPPPQPVPSPPAPPPTTTTNLTNLSYNTPIPSSGPNMSMNIASISTSSSTSSDEEPERRCKRKRKWADFFQRLMSEVIEKQEEMQKKFLETLEKRERDRLAREEAWRVQEMERLNREHDLLIQERSMAASKDAAVIAYLQKISGQEVVPKVAAQLQTHLQTRPHDNPIMPPAAPPQPQPQPQQQQQQQQVQQQQLSPIQSQLSLQTLFKTPENPKTDNGGGNFTPVASSSRWPKAEVQALIQLRTNMDLKYQENGPKGPLWEEMSAAMRKLGYNRNAKRCKEKWENINKYFKKVKESNKKRPEDSKTCPYFHQLDALYREKAIVVKPENPMMVPIMVQPEQQWPLQEDQRRDQSAMEDHNDDNGHNEDEDDDEEDEDDEAGGYEIVANKPPSVGTDE
ncbi:hypothetical protein ACSBR1_030359 [Camellia fascicularis]